MEHLNATVVSVDVMWASEAQKSNLKEHLNTTVVSADVMWASEAQKSNLKEHLNTTVSGGKPEGVLKMTVRVQTEDFDITKEINLLKEERKKSGTQDIGAIVTFTGTVRDMAGKTPISSMSLEHYPGMTEKQLERIAKEANERWPLLGTTIIHRIGELAPGDNIVLVITLSSHRHAAFEAADFLMDFLKSEAPFWKKEQPLAGDANWVDARDSDKQALNRWNK